MKADNKKVKDEGLGAPQTSITNNPSTWRYASREMGIANAKKVQDKIAGKKLVRLDAKTWVYV